MRCLKISCNKNTPHVFPTSLKRFCAFKARLGEAWNPRLTMDWGQGSSTQKPKCPSYWLVNSVGSVIIQNCIMIILIIWYYMYYPRTARTIHQWNRGLAATDRKTWWFSVRFSLHSILGDMGLVCKQGSRKQRSRETEKKHGNTLKQTSKQTEVCKTPETEWKQVFVYN